MPSELPTMLVEREPARVLRSTHPVYGVMRKPVRVLSAFFVTGSIHPVLWCDAEASESASALLLDVGAWEHLGSEAWTGSERIADVHIPS